VHLSARLSGRPVPNDKSMRSVSGERINTHNASFSFAGLSHGGAGPIKTDSLALEDCRDLFRVRPHAHRRTRVCPHGAQMGGGPAPRRVTPSLSLTCR